MHSYYNQQQNQQNHNQKYKNKNSNQQSNNANNNNVRNNNNNNAGSNVQSKNPNFNSRSEKGNTKNKRRKRYKKYSDNNDMQPYNFQQQGSFNKDFSFELTKEHGTNRLNSNQFETHSNYQKNNHPTTAYQNPFIRSIGETNFESKLQENELKSSRSNQRTNSSLGYHSSSEKTKLISKQNHQKSPERFKLNQYTNNELQSNYLNVSTISYQKQFQKVGKCLESNKQEDSFLNASQININNNSNENVSSVPPPPMPPMDLFPSNMTFQTVSQMNFSSTSVPPPPPIPLLPMPGIPLPPLPPLLPPPPPPSSAFNSLPNQVENSDMNSGERSVDCEQETSKESQEQISGQQIGNNDTIQQNPAASKVFQFQCKNCSQKFDSLRDCLSHELVLHFSAIQEQQSEAKTNKRKKKPKHLSVNMSEEDIAQRDNLEEQICQYTDESLILQEISRIYQPHPLELNRAFERIYDDLKYELTKQGNWEIHAFGSSINAMSLKGSDMDFYVNRVQIGKVFNPKTLFNQIKNLLYLSSNFSNVIGIPRARVPIVKCTHIQTNYSLDINLSSITGVYNSQFIANTIKFDPRIHPLLLVIKVWASRWKITTTGRMTNYCLTLLVFFYLQNCTPPVLPSIKEFQQDSPPFIIEGFNFVYNLPKDFIRKNTLSVFDLIKGFFEFYTNYNFKAHIISPYLGESLNKYRFVNKKINFPEYEKQVEFLKTKFEKIDISDKGRSTSITDFGNTILTRNQSELAVSSCICIQDPFCLTLNKFNSGINVFSHFIQHITYGYVILVTPKITLSQFLVRLFYEYELKILSQDVMDKKLVSTIKDGSTSGKSQQKQHQETTSISSSSNLPSTSSSLSSNLPSTSISTSSSTTSSSTVSLSSNLSHTSSSSSQTTTKPEKSTTAAQGTTLLTTSTTATAISKKNSCICQLNILQSEINYLESHLKFDKKLLKTLDSDNSGNNFLNKTWSKKLHTFFIEILEEIYKIKVKKIEKIASNIIKSTKVIGQTDVYTNLNIHYYNLESKLDLWSARKQSKENNIKLFYQKTCDITQMLFKQRENNELFSNVILNCELKLEILPNNKNIKIEMNNLESGNKKSLHAMKMLFTEISQKVRMMIISKFSQLESSCIKM